MGRLLICISLLGLFLSACQPAAMNQPAAVDLPAAEIPPSGQPEPVPVTSTQSQPETAQLSSTVTPGLSSITAPTATAAPTGTNTPTPDGFIQVDTLEQEVYPFVENGRCSLAEAIVAANLAKPVDSCPAGGESETVIELLPGTYRLTQIDHTPQQLEWMISTTGTGNALPAIGRSLTLRGNGAVLSREDAAEPFRILEVVSGIFTLENLTLQGGEVQAEDWGGAMLVQNASLVMDGVTVKDSRAENGGGVHFSNGGLTVRDSLFTGNQASFVGGGLYAGMTKAEITNSQFIDNVADGLGAGVHVQEIFLTLTDCIFIGNRAEARGGGINLEKANAAILRSQFYRNYADISGAGVSGRNFIYEEDIIEAEADPMETMVHTETYIQLATQVPGFRETLVAHPSGMYLQRTLDIQVHESCFLGNTDRKNDPLDTAVAIAGRTNSENNYYGDPSGPGGMGNGSGQSVGGMVVFEPFLTEPPAHCDLDLASR